MRHIRTAMNFLFLLAFGFIPTWFMFREYDTTGTVPWWLAIVWFVIMVFSIGVTYGKGDSE